MKADRFPLPMIQEIFDELAGNVRFATLDVFFGYWQIMTSESSKERTTFVCRHGTYMIEVMPFGLMNAPSTFPRMMDELLGRLLFVRVYLDEAVFFSEPLLVHVAHIRHVVLLVSNMG